MSEELQRVPLSKKGQRHVTPFTGNELLYDYIVGALDKERANAVQLHLENSKEAQQDLHKIQNGLQYAMNLKAVSVSKALQERLSTPSSYLSVLFRKARIDRWPVGVKWGLEALVIVFVIVTVLSLAPWEKVLKLRLASSDEVILTELNKNPMVASNDTAELPKNTETPEFVDEGIKPKETPIAVAAAKSPAVPVVAAEKAKATPVPQPTAKATPAAVAAKVAQADSNEAESETETAETEHAAKPTGGFLYRGQLEVTNLEAVGPKIVEKITEIGGRKAGEVELGWQKNPGSSYFHFTIPEAKYGELKEFLSGYGKPRLNLEKHPRVMPDGIIRLIITVDEAKK